MKVTIGEKKADPDARAAAHLSNEQTFLSWLRTGFNLIAVGLAAAQFLKKDLVASLPLTTIFSATLVLGGVGLAILGSIRYREVSRQIDTESFEPTMQIATAGTAIAIISGVLALLFVILLYERG
jgi:uncharacterized membrane protein YidH (DUF202 family)